MIEKDAVLPASPKSVSAVDQKSNPISYRTRIYKGQFLDLSMQDIQHDPIEHVSSKADKLQEGPLMHGYWFEHFEELFANMEQHHTKAISAELRRFFQTWSVALNRDLLAQCSSLLVASNYTNESADWPSKQVIGLLATRVQTAERELKHIQKQCAYLSQMLENIHEINADINLQSHTKQSEINEITCESLVSSRNFFREAFVELDNSTKHLKSMLAQRTGVDTMKFYPDEGATNDIQQGPCNYYLSEASTVAVSEAPARNETLDRLEEPIQWYSEANPSDPWGREACNHMSGPSGHEHEPPASVETKQPLDSVHYTTCELPCFELDAYRAENSSRTTTVSTDGLQLSSRATATTAATFSGTDVDTNNHLDLMLPVDLTEEDLARIHLSKDKKKARYRRKGTRTYASEGARYSSEGADTHEENAPIHALSKQSEHLPTLQDATLRESSTPRNNSNHAAKEDLELKSEAFSRGARRSSTVKHSTDASELLKDAAPEKKTEVFSRGARRSSTTRHFIDAPDLLKDEALLRRPRRGSTLRDFPEESKLRKELAKASPINIASASATSPRDNIEGEKENVVKDDIGRKREILEGSALDIFLHDRDGLVRKGGTYCRTNSEGPSVDVENVFQEEGTAESHCIFGRTATSPSAPGGSDGRSRHLRRKASAEQASDASRQPARDPSARSRHFRRKSTDKRREDGDSQRR